MSVIDKSMNRILIYSSPTIIIFVVTVVLYFTPNAHHTWSHLLFHSTIEAIGAIIAIILAIVLLSTENGSPQEFHKIYISAALLGMGALDLFHSFVEPSQNFVWLHSVASLVGGIFFSLTWLPQKVVSKPIMIPLVSLVFACCFALMSILFPEKIPTMVQDGHFTFFAKNLNLVGGFGFLLGATWFYKNYYYKNDNQQILFANLCLLFGVSTLLFEFSQLWSRSWWFWHGTRLLAYMVAMALIFVIYKKIEKEKDTVLIELKKALDEIKTLRGILPICMHCKKIRSSAGDWEIIEKYITEHSYAEFSHGLCEDCLKKHYPEYKH